MTEPLAEVDDWELNGCTLSFSC